MRNKVALALLATLAFPALPAHADDTSLLDAAFAGNVTAARRLVAAGAQVNQADENGYTPLHWAAFEGNVALVRLLLAAGAHPNAADHSGATPLILAAAHGHAAAVAALLAGGAKPEVRAHGGFTAEDLATADRYLDVLMVLRRARGATPQTAEDRPQEAPQPEQTAAQAFQILAGDKPLDDEAFLFTIKDADPDLGARYGMFGPARALRTVGGIGGNIGWLGLGVAVVGFIVQQTQAGSGQASDGYLAAGYGRTVGMALLEVGLGTWATGWTASWLLAPHGHPFTDAEARAAAVRYNEARGNAPALQVVTPP